MKLNSGILVGALLLSSFSADANYLLITASGSVTSAEDANNHLGYGSGHTYKGEMTGILGQTVIQSWLLDLDLAGPDILGGAQPGRAVYTGGSCPGSGSGFLQPLAFTLGGAMLTDSVSAPQSQHCAAAEVWDQALNQRFDEFLVSSEDWAQSYGNLDDGSTITKSSYLGQVSRVDGYGFDFFEGVELDQSFVWTRTFDQTTDGFGVYTGNSSIENCFGSVCATALLHDFTINFNLNVLTAQVIPGLTAGKISASVPEPGTHALLGTGLICLLAAVRRRRLRSSAR